MKSQPQTSPKLDISCVQHAASIICTKWTPLIIRQLAQGPKGFCQIQDAIPGLTPRVLSQRLELLNTEKIIQKDVIQVSPIRVEYSLSPKGQDLIPILKSMANWGAIYNKKS